MDTRARLALWFENRCEISEGPVGVSRPAGYGRAEHVLVSRGMAAQSRTRDIAGMATTTSGTQLVVLPLESSIPPEVTLYQWRHRKLASRARGRARGRRLAPPLTRFAKRAA